MIYNKDTITPILSCRRKIVLGTHPISLTRFTNAGVLGVFASCDRPTVIFEKNGKLTLSNVNVQEVSGMVPFHSEMFPECLALSNETGIIFNIYI